MPEKECSIECAIAKVFGSETLDFVVDELVQIHGGNGYITEFGAERMYRDSRINRIFEGTNEINRMVITGNLLKSAMKGKLPLIEAMQQVAQQIKAGQSRTKAVHACLANQQQIIEACKQLFLFTSDIVVQRILATLKDDQEVIALLADMIIQIFAMESGLLSAKKMVAKQGEQKAELHIAAVKAYIADMLPHMATWSKQVMAFAETTDACASCLGWPPDLGQFFFHWQDEYFLMHLLLETY